MSIETLLWLFPVTFMIHDFEEIVGMHAWLDANRRKIQTLPAFLQRMLSAQQSLSTASFAMMVAVIFLIFVLLTFLTVQFKLFTFFFCVLLFYEIHLVIHVIQWIAWRGYVPAVITSILTFPYGIFALYVLESQHLIGGGSGVLMLTVVVSVLGITGLLGLFRFAGAFEKWLHGFKVD